MPTYCFRCNKCDQTKEVFRQRMDPPKGPTCPNGHKAMVRDFKAERYGGMTDWTEPLESVGAGVMPDQVAEARQVARDKGIPIEYKSDGTALFRSKRSRDRALKKLGLVDKDAYC